MDQLPQVCIIIPERNEKPSIRTCLDAVLSQDYPQSLVSIMVVDGVSTDGTREVLSEYEKKYPFFKVIESPRKIVAPGFNMALRRTRADIIIRVDGHTVIASDYVRQCVTALRYTQADNVGGKMNAVSTTFFGQAVALATSSPFGIGGSRFHYSDEEEWVDTVYMGAWPRHVFERIGLFDEELVRNQDDEFNCRLRATGGRILLSPEIKSKYTVRSSMRSLWCQYYQYGYWKVRVLQKHPRQMSLRQFVPPAFVLALLLSILFALFPIFHPTSFVIPVLYLLTNLFISLYLASKHNWNYLLLFPLVFAILHISYGLGFLVGLYKFWNRWGDKIGQTPKWSHETIG
jgi:succinoglycan biosynthesis protein ExoA